MKPVNLIALLLFVAALAGVLMMKDHPQLRAQGWLLKVTSPVVRKGSETERNFRSIAEDLDSRLALEGENRQLKEKLHELPLIVEEVQRLRAENIQLKTSLGFLETAGFELVAARVLQTETNLWWHSLMIDKGAKDGIRTDQAVRGPEGLIGKVTVVGDNTATVLLMTDEMCQVPSMIVGATAAGQREYGIVQGWRGGVQDQDRPELRMSMLPRQPQAQPGAQVFTSGEGGIFPSGIPVGRIREVIPGDLSGEATLIPEVNFLDLDFVFVITTANPADGPVNRQTVDADLAKEAAELEAAEAEPVTPSR